MAAIDYINDMRRRGIEQGRGIVISIPAEASVPGRQSLQVYSAERLPAKIAACERNGWPWRYATMADIA